MKIQELYTVFTESAGISTDTRTLQNGMIFFALRGESFDANELVQTALDKGARLVVTENSAFSANPSCLVCSDSLLMLQSLARLHRQQCKCTFIAITGTNGKTTTKELLRETLSSAGSVQSTQGNLNNHIGVPLTLLSLNIDTSFAIIEMGANHPGEIEQLCALAEPDFGLITNIGRAHLEGFGSFEGVVQTKTELYRHLSAQAKQIFVSGDDELLLSLSENQSRIIYSTKSLSASIIHNESPYLQVSWDSGAESFITHTKLIGDYNLPNVLAAISIALHFGGEAKAIHQKLEEYTPTNMRSQWIDTGRNKLILDAYNANPSSMAKALENFITLNASNKLIILGDMRELGSYANEEHGKILTSMESMNIQKAILIGPHFMEFKSDFPQFSFFEDVQSTLEMIQSKPISDHTILLKGSRGIGVEKLKDVL